MLQMANKLTCIFFPQTIFEINATSKKSGHAVMRAKRDLHDNLIHKIREDAIAPADKEATGKDGNKISDTVMADENTLVSNTVNSLYCNLIDKI